MVIAAAEVERVHVPPKLMHSYIYIHKLHETSAIFLLPRTRPKNGDGERNEKKNELTKYP